MSRMSNGQGGHIEIDYDEKHDVTNWREWYDDERPGGGGQEGGDRRSEIQEHFEKHGFTKEGPS